MKKTNKVFDALKKNARTVFGVLAVVVAVVTMAFANKPDKKTFTDTGWWTYNSSGGFYSASSYDFDGATRTKLCTDQQTFELLAIKVPHGVALSSITTDGNPLHEIVEAAIANQRCETSGDYEVDAKGTGN